MKRFLALAFIIVALCPDCRPAKAAAPQEMEEIVSENMLEQMSDGDEEEDSGMMVDGDISLSEENE